MAGVIIVGGGLVGLALARELQRREFLVQIFEAGEAGREASWAGAGMLGGYQTANPVLRPLAIAGARLYPNWIAELERETLRTVGYRRSGTLVVVEGDAKPLEGWTRATPEAEPELRLRPGAELWLVGGDHSVNNRELVRALVASVRARGILLREGARVEKIERAPDGRWQVTSGGLCHRAEFVVNAAGAWAGEVPGPVKLPVRPRKGQMLRLRSAENLRHVIEAPGVYLVPRAGGQVLVGATLEDVGFDCEVKPEAIEQLRRRAMAWVPALEEAEVQESWAGVRPCAPDELPILGETRCAGYWAATAHFRDGILLAPLTAKILAHAMSVGRMTRALDLEPFLPARFDM